MGNYLLGYIKNDNSLVWIQSVLNPAEASREIDSIIDEPPEADIKEFIVAEGSEEEYEIVAFKRP